MAALLRACSDRDAAVQSLRIYSGAFRALRPPPGAVRQMWLSRPRRWRPVNLYRGDSPLAWAKTQGEAMERVNTAAATISQFAPEPVRGAAWAVARDAFAMTHGGAEESARLSESAIQFRQIRAQVLGR